MTTSSSQHNEAWFNAVARAKKVWRESVEHIADDLHADAIRLGRRAARTPRVADLGAGETGMSTYPYLRAGCEVYAIDAAADALARLEEGAHDLPGKLVLCAEDIEPFFARTLAAGETFDIIVARSFLHHIPDYLQLLRQVRQILSPTGVFVSYEDPPPYDRTDAFSLFYSRFSYFTLRPFRGNYLRGLKTRLRRLKGNFRDDLPEDTVEYHIVRNGVDDEKIREEFERDGFSCEIRKYFTTDNLATKHLGRKLGIINSFAVLAHRPSPAGQ